MILIRNKLASIFPKLATPPMTGISQPAKTSLLLPKIKKRHQRHFKKYLTPLCFKINL
jgi:hypothetical protein